MADFPDPIAALPATPPVQSLPTKIGGGEISFRVGLPDLEIELPEMIVIPTPRLPCDFPIPQIPGIPLPKVPSLKDLVALFGIPIPEIELPTVCPEVVEAALVAAVLAYEAAEG